MHNPAANNTGDAAPIRFGAIEADPLVSVLIANYNYGRFVGEAIESVLAQGHDRLEVIVCDDGSTDDSREVIAGFAERDPRVRLVAKSNGGQGSAFNAAHAASSGSILCFLDSDDLFLPGKIAAVVEGFRTSDAGLLIHQMMIVDEQGRDLQRIPTFTRFERGWIGERVIARGGRWRWMPTSGVALRRELADRIFPMPEAPFRRDADMFMLELAPLLAEVAAIEQVLGRYRFHGENSFSRKGMDLDLVERSTHSIGTALAEVNGRLRELGLEHLLLDPARNVQLREFGLLRRALRGEGSRLELGRDYRDLAGALLRDDLYSTPQKAWALMLYAGAVALPARARPGWVSSSLGLSRGKETLRRVTDALRGRRAAAPRAGLGG